MVEGDPIVKLFDSVRCGVLAVLVLNVGEVDSYGADNAFILSLLTTAPCPLGLKSVFTIRKAGTACNGSSGTKPSDIDLYFDDPGPPLIIALIYPEAG